MKLRGYVTLCGLGLTAAALLLAGRSRAESPPKAFTTPRPDKPAAGQIVFARKGSYDRDLFLKSMTDDRAPINLTKTREVTETLPVVSHDNRKIAYRVDRNAREEEIHVARLDTKRPGLQVLSMIRMEPPATFNITGIDFSPDDTRLYFSVEVTDVSDVLMNNRQEMFSVKLDGSDRIRLTQNGVMDTWPSVVAR